jgi:hypothetical protein
LFQPSALLALCRWRLALLLAHDQAQHLNEDRLDLLREAFAETVDGVVIRMGVRADVP